VIDQRVALDRGDDARRHSETEGEEESRARQLEGRGQSLENQSHGGLAVTERLAEVSVDRAREEAAVLDDPRILEAHRLAEARDGLGGSVWGQEQCGGIAREMQDREHDHGHAEEDEHGLPQAPQNVRLHSAAGASKWPPHSPILAPARPGRTRTAVARSIM